MKNAWFGYLALVVSLAAAPAVAESRCPAGPEGNLCKAENGDPMAMYMVGREAYAEGREKGDLSAAREWALRSRSAGYRGGRMLLKMIYVQMGEGTHHDYVQAHIWLTDAIQAGDEYLEPWRERLEEKMSSEQLAEARNTPR